MNKTGRLSIWTFLQIFFVGLSVLLFLVSIQMLRTVRFSYAGPTPELSSMIEGGDRAAVPTIDFVPTTPVQYTFSDTSTQKAPKKVSPPSTQLAPPLTPVAPPNNAWQLEMFKELAKAREEMTKNLLALQEERLSDREEFLEAMLQEKEKHFELMSELVGEILEAREEAMQTLAEFQETMFEMQTQVILEKYELALEVKELKLQNELLKNKLESSGQKKNTEKNPQEEADQAINLDSDIPLISEFSRYAQARLFKNTGNGIGVPYTISAEEEANTVDINQTPFHPEQDTTSIQRAQLISTIKDLYSDLLIQQELGEKIDKERLQLFEEMLKELERSIPPKQNQ
ncbi:Hypothetical protein PBC10988_8080 [Planctomycetales bacterium 10988]|nr:Hypothetical protein PBC10988_8080 [Planctomycetales bacterium 10988]